MATVKKFDPIEQAVIDTAISEGAKEDFARIVLAQFKHESSNFKSNVYKKNNNPMGMKVPYKRKSPFIAGAGTKPPSNEGATPYARFRNIQDATRDLFHWLRYRNIDFTKIDNVEDYSEKLRQKSYMGNTQAAKKIYIAGLSRWLKSMSGYISSSTFPVMLLVILAISFYFLIYK